MDGEEIDVIVDFAVIQLPFPELMIKISFNFKELECSSLTNLLYESLNLLSNPK